MLMKLNFSAFKLSFKFFKMAQITLNEADDYLDVANNILPLSESE